MSSSAFTPSTNYANAATPSNEGLVNTGAQTFGGVKTFQDGAVFSTTGTQSTLTHYEENTWTPVIAFLTSNGTAAITTRYAKYSRIGRLVFLDCTFIVSKGTAQGALQLTGLPYAANSDNSYTILSPLVQNQSTTAFWYAWIGAGQTKVQFAKDTSGTNLDATDLGASITLRFSTMYRI